MSDPNDLSASLLDAHRQAWEREEARRAVPPLDRSLYWYNFRTGRMEEVVGFPSDFAAYIPQDAATQALFIVYQRKGDTSKDAAQKVLELHAQPLAPPEQSPPGA